MGEILAFLASSVLLIIRDSLIFFKLILPIAEPFKLFGATGYSESDIF